MDNSALPKLQKYRRPLNIRGIYLSLLLATLYCTGIQAAPNDSSSKKLTDVSESYYRHRFDQLDETDQLISKDIKRLYSHIIKLQEQDQNDTATAVLVKNLNTATRNIDSKRTPVLLKFLLENYLIDSANLLVNAALDTGDRFTSSRIHYRLAVHYFSHDNIEQASKHLTSIFNEKALTVKERDYATLMFGASLQQLKKHREALKIYKRIKKDSYYYSYAQLNSAVAFIRQGWWTDAQIAIEDALQQKTPKELQELTNRLLVVLAYSQLQNEFYRNARNNFRRVAIESQYVDRALLGMGLCALAQKDYLGAINAFSRLRQYEGETLPILEARLMVPYTYDQMGDTDEAAIGYSEAVAYFENKKQYYYAQLTNLERGGDSDTIETWSDVISKSVFLAYKHLDSLQIESIADKKLKAQIVSLRKSFKAQIAEQGSTALKSKLSHIQSYASQSQYGLAKLYDDQ